MAAISAHKGLIDGCFIGMHKLLVVFLKCVNPLNPPCRVMIPQWDLNVVLDNLCMHSFEPLSLADIKWLSLKSPLMILIRV